MYAKIGDITKESVCAVVNAANSSLFGGGGVDGAIHRVGGTVILDECREIRRSRYPDGLPTGEAVATTAGELPAEYVIHTVGPVYSRCGSDCATLLSQCYLNSLRLAVELGCRSIAFPAISTGIYGYPKAEAAQIAYEAITAFLQRHSIEVTLIFHNQADNNVFIDVVTNRDLKK